MPGFSSIWRVTLHAIWAWILIPPSCMNRKNFLQRLGSIVGHLASDSDASHTCIARILSEWWAIWAWIFIPLTHASQDFGTTEWSCRHEFRHSSGINHEMLVGVIGAQFKPCGPQVGLQSCHLCLKDIGPMPHMAHNTVHLMVQNLSISA